MLAKRPSRHTITLTNTDPHVGSLSKPKALRGDLAKIKYERTLQGAYAHSQAIFDFALLLLRTLTIINGGGIIGLTTFLGHFSEFGQGNAVFLWASFGLFALGLVAAVAATLSAYFAQVSILWGEMMDAERVRLRALGEDTVVNKTMEDEHFTKASASRWLAVGFAISSICFFAAGSAAALLALANGHAPPT